MSIWQAPSASSCCISICFPVCNAVYPSDGRTVGTPVSQAKGKSILSHLFCCTGFQALPHSPASSTAISWDAHFVKNSLSWSSFSNLIFHPCSCHVQLLPVSKRKQKLGLSSSFSSSSSSSFLPSLTLLNTLNLHRPLPEQKCHQFARHEMLLLVEGAPSFSLTAGGDIIVIHLNSHAHCLGILHMITEAKNDTHKTYNPYNQCTTDCGRRQYWVSEIIERRPKEIHENWKSWRGFWLTDDECRSFS